jgi:hypothetical protein
MNGVAGRVARTASLQAWVGYLTRCPSLRSKGKRAPASCSSTPRPIMIRVFCPLKSIARKASMIREKNNPLICRGVQFSPRWPAIGATKAPVTASTPEHSGYIRPVVLRTRVKVEGKCGPKSAESGKPKSAENTVAAKDRLSLATVAGPTLKVAAIAFRMGWI